VICNGVAEVLKLTGGRGADSAIEALGIQATLDAGLGVIKPGGTLTGLGVYSGDLTILLPAFVAAWAMTASTPPCAPVAKRVCAV